MKFKVIYQKNGHSYPISTRSSLKAARRLVALIKDSGGQAVIRPAVWS